MTAPPQTPAKRARSATRRTATPRSTAKVAVTPRGTAGAQRRDAPRTAAPRPRTPAGRYRKVSVTLPADLLDRLRARVGEGNLSGYLAETLEEKERLAALDEFIALMIEEHGEPSEEDIQEVRRRWPAARAVI